MGVCLEKKCRLGCSAKIDSDARSQIKSDYYSLLASAQDAHLFSSLVCSDPKQVVANSERHRLIAVKYTVCVRGLTETICKKAFTNLYGIS